MCKGDPKAPDASEVAQRSYQAALQYLPGIFELENKNILPNEQAQFAATKEVAPEYANLQNELYEGPGQQLVKDVNKTEQELNPEFFSTRAASSAALNKLLSSVDLSGMLSGSEEAEIERGLNRTNAEEGNTGVGGPLTTIKNAMTFGQAGNAKKTQQQQIGTGLVNAASGFLPASKVGIDPLQVATGRPSYAPNIGATTQAGAGQFMQNSADATANQAVLNASRKSTAEKTLGALPDYSA